MFDMVRPMLPGEYGMGRMADERHYKPEPPLVESAWERGNTLAPFKTPNLTPHLFRVENCQRDAKKIHASQGARHRL